MHIHVYTCVFLKPGPQLPDFQRFTTTDLIYSMQGLSTAKVQALLNVWYKSPLTYTFSVILCDPSDQCKKKSSPRTFLHNRSVTPQVTELQLTDHDCVASKTVSVWFLLFELKRRWMQFQRHQYVNN